MREPFLQRPAPDEQWELLRRATPLLEKVYLAGCNHIDFGPHAILMSPTSFRDDRVIDLEHASFISDPSIDTLAALVGYFAWSVGTNRGWVQRDLLEAWFAEILNRFELQRFADRMWKIWELNYRRRGTIRERLARR